MNKLIPIFLLALVLSADAATNYVRRGAAGSGASWSDAIDTLPVTLTRGDVYFIAGGNYPGRDFNEAVSGTNLITIKAATLTSHGTDTGWSTNYASQAVFTNACNINSASSGYWLFDGQQGDFIAGTRYGLKFLSTVVGGQTFNLRAGGANTTFSYCDFAGPADGVTNEFDFALETACLTAWGAGSPVTVTHCYLHGASTILDGISNWTIEHSVLTDCKPIAGGAHGNMLFLGYGTTNHTFRYNLVFNYNDEGYFVTGYGGSPRFCFCYGNVFYSPSVVAGHYPRGVEFRGNYNYTNIHLYNNTFGPMAGSAIYNGTHGTGNSTVGCTAINNLAFGSSYSYYGDSDGLAGFGDVASTNNAVAVSNPFVSTNTLNFRLSQATEPGLTLHTPFSTDPDGTTRGADGSWDLGAYEFGGQYIPPADSPTPPTANIGTLYIGNLK